MPNAQTSNAAVWSENLENNISGAIKGLSRALFVNYLALLSLVLRDDYAPPFPPLLGPKELCLSPDPPNSLPSKFR
jgi:hypothetical protein